MLSYAQPDLRALQPTSHHTFALPCHEETLVRGTVTALYHNIGNGRFGDLHMIWDVYIADTCQFVFRSFVKVPVRTWWLTVTNMQAITSSMQLQASCQSCFRLGSGGDTITSTVMVSTMSHKMMTYPNCQVSILVAI